MNTKMDTDVNSGKGPTPPEDAGQPQPQSAPIPASSSASGEGLAAVAAIDTEVPDPDSAFMDMRDPMVSADGHRPNKSELVRLGVGFTVSAIACAIPWVALSTLILPDVLEGIDPASKESMLGIINAAGSVVALLANVIFGTFSDLTRSRFGKRSPWIVAGGIVAGLSVGAIAFTHSQAMIVVLWCCAQLGYNMMLAPYVATMSDRVPDKFRGTISGFYGAGIATGQTLGSFVGAQLIKNGTAGVFAGWMMGFAVFALCGIVVVVIWPRERSNRDEVRGEVTVKTVLTSFRPPRHAPDFYYALAGRTMMMGGYWMINTYQLFIAQDYVFAGDPNAKIKAASVIATMAVITLIVSLLAAVSAGPITDKLGMRKVPVALASCLFAVGALMPLLFRSQMGMYLFAAIAGLGYGIYNAIDQALNVSVLPNPDEAGKDLGILNLANTLSTVIGSLMTSMIVVIVKSVLDVEQTPPVAYSVVFIVAIVIVLVAAALIMRIKNVK
jgi:MFS family permease